MDRRNFLAAASAVAAMGAAGAAQAQDAPSANEILEFRKYIPAPGKGKKVLEDYLKNAAIPAWNRLGIEPVGVFTVVYGQNSPSLYVLIPHKSIESVLTTPEKLLADAEYMKAADEFLNTPPDAPAFMRMESEILRAFNGMPQVTVPPQKKEDKRRIFELRIYESHNPIKAKKKISMFNEGGEIEIFKRAGANPVFYGETIIGPLMPNLHYMLCHDDMAAREVAWKNFRDDPQWKKLSADEQYKDTVSNITDIILQPTGYSQL